MWSITRPAAANAAEPEHISGAFDMDLLQRLAVALAIGLLIGLERGWHGRVEQEGHRIAGIRTFGLISLLGGLWAVLAEELGEVVLAVALLAFAAVLTVGHAMTFRQEQDRGITTVVAALVTFGLGALAARGYLTVAASAAVVTMILLGLKPVLHSWLEKLEREELYATFKMLLISVVLLPILPNEGYGPWDALNPYEIWWYVVLIAGISFGGYFAVRIAGTRLGLLFTSLFGGLASSTALTLTFSRIGRHQMQAHRLLAAGVVVAAGTMFPRMLLEVGIVNAALLPQVAPALAAMTVVGYLGAAWLWFRREPAGTTAEVRLSNPFEILPALQFAALLVVIMLLSQAFREWFGDAGIYVLSTASGISDVDAITLSLSGMTRNGLDPATASRAIVLAGVVNTATKGALVAFICGGTMARRVGLVFLATIAAGVAAVLVQP